MNKMITSDVLIAYSQCPRKAFLLLCTNQKGIPHEYSTILEQRKQANQRQFISTLKQKSPDVQPYARDNLKSGNEFLINAALQIEGLEVACGLLTKVEGRSSLGNYHYAPTIFVGTHKIGAEQKLELVFAGHVLERIQNKPPATGKIVGANGKSHRVKLENSGKTLIPLLEPLQDWVAASSVDPPLIILNKHCTTCPFRTPCREQAEQEDNLSLLDRVTPKVVRNYEKKGIFPLCQNECNNFA
ncbi:MAG: IS66 family transposase, partial [Anaerolineae bacterium]|nr:IS66 family transposase [Anaerolineae bacterium]